jgi:hypothetical protein
MIIGSKIHPYKIQFLLMVLLVSGCVSVDPELKAHLEAEADFHTNQAYREAISNHEAFRPEVYADPEFVADCEYYRMPECFE